MKKQRLDNANNTVIGHLNINSFRNKFVFVEDIIKLFDSFLVSKLDLTFLSNQFRINGYKIFRFDRNRFRGRLIFVHLPNFEVITIEFYQSIQN